MVSNKNIYGALVSVLLLVGGDALAREPSITFLPMITGEWQVDIRHSQEGDKTLQSCMTDADLQAFYSDREIFLKAQENERNCRLVTNSTKNSLSHLLKCDEQKLTVMMTYHLMKEGYNKYKLARKLTTIPYRPAVNFVETAIFTRVGKCS